MNFLLRPRRWNHHQGREKNVGEVFQSSIPWGMKLRIYEHIPSSKATVRPWKSGSDERVEPPTDWKPVPLVYRWCVAHDFWGFQLHLFEGCDPCEAPAKIILQVIWRDNIVLKAMGNSWVPGDWERSLHRGVCECISSAHLQMSNT